MLYRTLKRLIELGNTDDLEEKIDIFFATGKINETQYKELTELLAAKNAE